MDIDRTLQQITVNNNNKESPIVFFTKTEAVDMIAVIIILVRASKFIK